MFRMATASAWWWTRRPDRGNGRASGCCGRAEGNVVNTRVALCFLMMPLVAACDDQKEWYWSADARESFAQCRLDHESAVPLCMQAKGYVVDERLVARTGIRCNAFGFSIVSTPDCYR